MLSHFLHQNKKWTQENSSLPVVNSNFPISPAPPSHYWSSFVRWRRDVSWRSRVLCKIVQLGVNCPWYGNGRSVPGHGNHWVPPRQHLTASPDLLVHLIGRRSWGSGETGLWCHWELVGTSRPTILRTAGRPVQVVVWQWVAIDPPVQFLSRGGYVHILQALRLQHPGQGLGFCFGPGVDYHALWCPGMKPLLLLCPTLTLALWQLAAKAHSWTPLICPQALALPLSDHPPLMEGNFPLSRACLSLDLRLSLRLSLGLGCPALPFLSQPLTLLRRQFLASCLLRPLRPTINPLPTSMRFSEVSVVQQHSEVLASPPPVRHVLGLWLRTSGAITESMRKHTQIKLLVHFNLSACWCSNSVCNPIPLSNFPMSELAVGFLINRF